jgi:hypothetical protein
MNVMAEPKENSNSIAHPEIILQASIVFMLLLSFINLRDIALKGSSSRSPSVRSTHMAMLRDITGKGKDLQS